MIPKAEWAYFAYYANITLPNLYNMHIGDFGELERGIPICTIQSNENDGEEVFLGGWGGIPHSLGAFLDFGPDCCK